MAETFPRRIWCSHDGLGFFSFPMELSRCDGGGEAYIVLCRECYDVLAGQILLSVINEVAKEMAREMARANTIKARIEKT